MLMGVLERFREIGSLKAVGWTQENIIRMILYESLFIGILGGAMGLALGVFASSQIGSFGLTTVVSGELLLLSFLGAVLIGVAAGIYPALIASRMDPIEALRSE